MEHIGWSVYKHNGLWAKCISHSLMLDLTLGLINANKQYKLC